VNTGDELDNPNPNPISISDTNDESLVTPVEQTQTQKPPSLSRQRAQISEQPS